MTEPNNTLIDHFKVAISEKNFTFSEVSGLCIEYEPVYYRDGMSFMMGSVTVPGKLKPIRLILKKGLTDYVEYFQKWIDQRYQNWSGAASRRFFSRDVIIDMCEGDKVKIRWRCFGVLPVKIAVEPFNASKDTVVITSLELVVTKLIVEKV